MNTRRLYVGLGLVLLLVSLVGYVGIGRALVTTSATTDTYNATITATPTPATEENLVQDDSPSHVMVGPYLSYRILYDYYFTTKSIIRETMKVVYAYGGVIAEEKLVNDKLAADLTFLAIPDTST
ncbi:hypothetical protein V1525DRAFT_422122 [Lipomyces kononenkoae]|uniref:Uncharacterized protein n=1 Tax=Lipomyces kononenkoae TaxID=34357 RepID=A0ACC3SSH3_LIPKO